MEDNPGRKQGAWRLKTGAKVPYNQDTDSVTQTMEFLK